MFRKRKVVSEPCPLRAKDVPPPSTTSGGWLAGLREGRPPEWDVLVRRYGPEVYRWLRAKGLSEEDARDVAQSTFVEVRRSLPSFQWGGKDQSFRGWLRTIAMRRRAAYYKGRSQEPTTVALDPDSIEPSGPSDAGDEFVPEDRGAMVWDAIEAVRHSVEPTTMEAFLLTWFEGVSPREAAARLGMTPNAVYVARSRVLHTVEEELKGKVREDFPPAVWAAYDLVDVKKATPEDAAARTGLTEEEAIREVGRVAARVKEALRSGRDQ